MATLDTRLLPLIEALAVADADWLAFEILDGLRLGKVAEETRAELKSTRSAVRSAERPTRRSEERAVLPAPAVPIIGDEQIGKRMSEAVLMLQATLDQLEGIISGTPTLDGAHSPSSAGEGVTLVLQTDGEELSVRRRDVADARATLPRLQEALLAWVASTRNAGLGE